MRKYTIERMRRATGLLLSYGSIRESIVRNRANGIWAIGVSSDPEAIQYQEVSFRIEVLTAWIFDKHINWYLARYLSADEMLRRTELNTSITK